MSSDLSRRVWTIAIVLSSVIVGGCCEPSGMSLNSPRTTGATGSSWEAPNTTASFDVRFADVFLPQQQSGAEAAIETALDKTVSLQLFDVSLGIVAAELSDVHGINALIDHAALSEFGLYGIDEEPRITIDVSDVSLASALTLMLKPQELVWTVDCEVLIITHEEAAAELLTTRVYDVTSLVMCIDQDGQTWYDFDTLVDMVNMVVAPASWYEMGGEGCIWGATFGGGNVLVVSQAYPIQREVAALLAKLKTAAGDGPPPVRRREPEPEPSGVAFKRVSYSR